MRVVYIFESTPQGGAYKALLAMINEMRQLGVDVIILTGKRSALNDNLDREGFKNVAAGHETAIIPVHFHGILKPLRLLKTCLLYYKSEWRAVKDASKQINFKEIDLIHTNSARSTIGCRLSKKYGIPHITHLREFGDRDFDCIKRTPFYERILNNGTTAFISISKAIQTYWNSKGIDVKKNHLIYDGSYYKDITVSSDDSKRAKALKMIIAGGVYPTKGQHLAVEAMGFLSDEVRNNITLDIAGWGDKQYIAEMKQYAEEHGYANQIHFLGAINDVHERTGMYQIGLMCSRSEGFGLVTSEYMHGRLGVIASNAGSCPELITDGMEGQLFTSGDAKSLADCILRYYNDREFLIKMSIAAQKKARECFTSELNARNIIDLYKRLLKDEAQD